MSLKPTLLLIIDGWGIAPASDSNAVHLAKTPNLDALLASNNVTSLGCSGRAVGLPEGFMGNSEVGHMNIGAGRVVYQDMTRIDMAIEEGTLEHNAALQKLIKDTKARGGRLHLMGLLSDGGVHSHVRHLMALIAVARKAGLEVLVHAFLDGRDRSPTSGAGYVADFLEAIQDDDGVNLATFTGRYYAMDRDKRWERNQIAWDALVHGKGEFLEAKLAAPDGTPNAVVNIQAAYASGTTDEFMMPRIMTNDGIPFGTIRDNDGLFCFNFRADRSRQLSHIFVGDLFDVFDRGSVPSLSGFVTMTAYDSQLAVDVAFPRQPLTETLGEVVAALGAHQLRIAETEKYAHVTYFFNCGREDVLTNEDRILLPSPRDVATYDLKPEMSAEAVTDALIEAWNSDKYQLIVCNLANLDMVGHTGIIPAAIAACECVDSCVERIVATCATNGRLIVTADHGNAEELLSPAGTPHTAHTLNPVPLIIMEQGVHYTLRSDGVLGDIAPTILDLWDTPKPDLMTGTSLVTSFITSDTKED
ncbi:MAG: 2,3-bisphosphoglycerate-independent phosphoglycerate mutase [Pseudomonadota bacterium]